MTLKKDTTIFLILIFICFMSYSQVSFYVDTKETQVGETVHIISDLSEGQSLILSDDQNVDNIAILNEKNENRQYILNILPLGEGDFSIAPIRFELDENGDTSEVFSPTFEVNLISIIKEPEGTKETQMRPDVPFKKLKDKWNPIFWSFLMFLIIVVIAILAYLLNKKGKQIVFGKTKEPAHVIAKRLLEELKLKNYLENNKQKAFCVELSFIIKSYIHNRFELDIVEMTTDEISRLFSDKRGILPDNVKMIDYFRKMDLVKFAKYHLKDEILIEIFEFTREFVKKTEVKNDEIA